MKKQTTKEMKIKDLFTLSERTNNGAVVTTLENGNKYCFGYFSEDDKPEDIKNMMAKRERKVTASLNRRDLNENVFATKINDILSWWRDNLDKYEIIAHAAKQLQRIESKRYELTMMHQRINNHEQVSEIVKYNGIRQEITDTITESLENLKHISARYEDMVKRVCKLSLPCYCVPLLYSYGKSYHTYPLMDVYNALPANWEEMAKHGIKSVNTDLLPHVKNQTEPIKLEPETVTEPTMVESEVVEPETITEPTMVESEVVEPETVTEPTMVESEVVEPETVTEPTMVESEVVEPETVTEPTMVESEVVEPETVTEPTMVESEVVEPETVTEPTMVESEVVEPVTVTEPTMVESEVVEPETVTEPTMVESEVVEPETVTEPTMVESEVVEPETVTEPTMVESEVVEPETITEPTMVESEVVEPETITEPTMVESEVVEPETITEPTMVESEVVEPETITEPTMVESEVVEPETITEPTMVESEVVEPETITEPTMVESEVVEPETITEPTMVESVNLWLMSTAAAAVACLIVLISLSFKPHTAATAAPTVESVVFTISEPTMVESEVVEPETVTEPTMVESEVVEPETIDHINEVICTGSLDPYYNRVKAEISAYYSASVKSQLYELAELASVDDSEVIAALADPETDPETPESVPTVETITDTENTPESVEIMPTETDTETDAGTVSDTDTIDYNSSDYVELSVITTDANGNQVVNVYSVPLNE